MKVVVDYDVCASNAVCVGIVPEVFEVRDDGYLYVLNENPGPELADKVRMAANNGPTGAITLDADAERRGPPRLPAPAVHGSDSHRRPRGSSTSAAPAPPCSTGCSPGTRAGPSSCASRTPTPSVTARSG